MPEFTKIGYYDLTLEAFKGRLLPCIGRAEECERMERVVHRTVHNNCIVVGPNGIGKTSLLRGFAERYAQKKETKPFRVVECEASAFEPLNSTVQVPLQKYKEALDSLPSCVFIIDNFGALVYNKPIILQHMIQLLKPIADLGKVRLILSFESKEFAWLQNEQAQFLHFFEVLTLKPQPAAEQIQILRAAEKRFGLPHIQIPQTILELILSLVERFAVLGHSPGAGVSILDESVTLVKTKGGKEVKEEDVYQVISDKVGVPLTELQVSQKERLRQLEHKLNSHIIGQKVALNQIASTVKRAKLGLKNPNRPLGSFLVLGPSGVGKTETAKVLASELFGGKKSFVRIDMSEFGEAHTVARLIGAPAGYVGFEAGGGLTNAVKTEPYSLVLLDEIEKAHPKIFDVFLQILDDGRLTSGQGETIDFTQTVIMATSNLAVGDIIDGFKKGDDIHSEAFFQEKLVPALAQFFRLEFLNRFDAVLVFQPLTEEHLLEVAKLEIKKVEARVAKHKISFKIDPEILKKKIRTLSDPRFGARPVKRFIETTCENLISEKLLADEV